MLIEPNFYARRPIQKAWEDTYSSFFPIDSRQLINSYSPNTHVLPVALSSSLVLQYLRLVSRFHVRTSIFEKLATHHHDGGVKWEKAWFCFYTQLFVPEVM